MSPLRSNSTWSFKAVAIGEGVSKIGCSMLVPKAGGSISCENPSSAVDGT